MDTLKRRCNQIVMRYPQAAGMAVIGLNCGCTLVCGVSYTGEPLGSLQRIEAGPHEDAGQRPVCLTCRRSRIKIQDRIVMRKLIWPGEDFEKPDMELRRFIGQQVFGTKYEERD